MQYEFHEPMVNYGAGWTNPGRLWGLRNGSARRNWSHDFPSSFAPRTVLDSIFEILTQG